jgi:hypothetical protein
LASPEKTWNSFLAAMKRRDAKGLLRCCTGHMAEELGDKANAKDDNFWQEGEKEIGNSILIGIAYNKDKSKARISIQAKNKDSTEHIVMARIQGKWMFSEEYQAEMDDEFQGSVELRPRLVEDKPVAVTAEEEKQIATLIKQLGDGDAKKRSEAYDKLRNFGAKAAKFLEKAVHNPDPEISLQAKQLLGL